MTRFSRFTSILPCVTVMLTAGCAGEDSAALARDGLQDALRDSVGIAADPRVSLISDGGPPGSHLYLQLDTAAFANQNESQFVDHAREVARFATRHYRGSEPVDSVTVAALLLKRRGVWKIHHTTTFGSRELSGR